MTRPSLSQLLTRSGGLMAARIVGGATALLANILIARWFGADALGIFALVMAVVSLAAVMLPLGFQAVGVMFVSQYLEQDRTDLVSGFARRGYANIAVLGALTAAAVAIGLAVLPEGTWRDHAVTAAFVAAMAPALALINLNGSLLNAKRRPFASLLPDLLVKPALMVVAVAATILIFDGASVHILLGAICVSMWMAALCQAFALRGSSSAGATTPKAESRRWLKAALPWILIAILSDYFIALHLLLAGALAVPAQVAVLHICFRLRVLAAFGLRALYALILPDLYASHERADHAEFRSNLRRANGLALVYSVVVCLAIFPLGSWVLSLFGSEFEAGRNVLLIVCVAMIVRAAFGPAPAVMAMKGLHVQAVWILVAGTALSLGLGAALFPMMGIEAIAVAYTVGYSLIAIVQWWWVKRRAGIDCSVFAGVFSKTGRAKLAGVER